MSEIKSSFEQSDNPKLTLAVGVSACCGAVLTIGGSGTTHYYVCCKCMRPCDAMPRDDDEVAAVTKLVEAARAVVDAVNKGDAYAVHLAILTLEAALEP